jgi:hypothetical protein
MSEVLDQEPPQDPEDWSEEQWREWLLAAPPDPDLGRSHPLSKVRHGSGAVVAAAMFGLQEAIYGERPKVEIVAEADADGLDLGDIDLDLEHPEVSRLELPPEG